MWEAIQAHRARLNDEAADEPQELDLLTPEREIFTQRPLPDHTDNFALRSVAIPPNFSQLLETVVQAERLREVRALIGFTRLDAPDPEDPNLVQPAPLSREDPTWLPASEIRGEGIFLQLSEPPLLADWEARGENSAALEAYREAYGRFRDNRYSDRIHADFDRMCHWPGARYIALHTLSHLLLRSICIECGYSGSSLSERIYAGTADNPRTGILLDTAVPDAEGTLGGLVSLAEPDILGRLMTRALEDARHCSADPLCAERLPQAPADYLHGAACHVCLFIAETACERGNRFLDRRFVVAVGDPKLALLPDR